MTLNNYHTHTYRCKHATGDIADYTQAAKIAGMGRLGFSEHMPLPQDAWSHAHMEIDQLSEYVHKIRRQQELETDITLLAGGECEYIKAEKNYYKEILLDKYKLDYLLGAPHWIPMGDDWVGYTRIS
jgi:histidinol-phosphatase (PHP family)